jgi:hypothetical protein
MRNEHKEELAAVEKQLQELTESAESEREESRKQLTADYQKKIATLQSEAQAARVKQAELRSEHQHALAIVQEESMTHLKEMLAQRESDLTAIHTTEQDRLLKLNEELNLALRTEEQNFATSRHEAEHHLKVVRDTHAKQTEDLRTRIESEETARTTFK